MLLILFVVWAGAFARLYFLKFVISSGAGWVHGVNQPAQSRNLAFWPLHN